VWSSETRRVSRGARFSGPSGENNRSSGETGGVCVNRGDRKPARLTARRDFIGAGAARGRHAAPPHASGRGPDHHQRSVSALRGPQTGRGKLPAGTEVRVSSHLFCFSRPPRSGATCASSGRPDPLHHARSVPRRVNERSRAAASRPRPPRLASRLEFLVLVRLPRRLNADEDRDAGAR
jgi:hypothetical protein